MAKELRISNSPEEEKLSIPRNRVPMFTFNTIKKGESFLHLKPYQQQQIEGTPTNELKVAIPDSQSIQEKGFPCRQCSRSFSTKTGRTNHENAHARKKRDESPALAPTAEVTSIDVERKLTSHSPPDQAEVPVWGKQSKEDLRQIADSMYEEIVFFRKNLFLLPSGKAGKDYIEEMTRLINFWNNQSEDFSASSMKLLMCMPSILLQKTHARSKAKEHSETLARRLNTWKEGDFDKLLRETREIQKRLPRVEASRTKDKNKPITLFTKHMLKGNISAAIRTLEDTASSGVLQPTGDVINTLKSLHPNANEHTDDRIISNKEIVPVDPIIFEFIDGTMIREAAIKTKGAAGPSGQDADQWRRILASKNYGKYSSDLREAMACMLKTICRQEVDVERRSIEAVLACRLIPLDKNPGVRPIGIGEVMRRIFGKVLINTIKPDILKATGSVQVCAGQQAGCEAAVHAINQLFQEDETDGVILVDAANAFNSINRRSLLHNIKIFCPAMAQYIHNCYHRPSRLFLMGGKEIASQEGTTQGDPTAMPAYAIGLMPLLEILQEGLLTQEVKNAAYADDLAGTGKLHALKKWWDDVNDLGPLLGYNPKASKSYLIVKREKLEEAIEIFKDTGINITVDGHKYLGGFIGQKGGQQEYVKKLIAKWQAEIQTLSDIARSEPHLAYCAFVGGYVNKFTYYLRVMPKIEEFLKPLDEVINKHFIPSITENHHCSAEERLLLSLPVRMGGLAIPILSSLAKEEYQNSRELTRKFSQDIIEQKPGYDVDNREAKLEIKRRRKEGRTTTLENLRRQMTPQELKANDLAQAKGASNWLTTLPLISESFNLSKREFFDAIAVRYRWNMKHLPSTCACGKPFSVDHALSCPKGGFIYQRHNTLRDTIAQMLNQVTHDVAIEPMLEPITGERLNKGAITTDNARADISAGGFWVRGQRAFFDVKVFNAYALRYTTQSLKSAFASNEREKKRNYNERIIKVDHGSFTPLIFSMNGGMGVEAEHFFRALANLISDKSDACTSHTMSWIRTKVSFALTRSVVTCIRGTRTLKPNLRFDEIDLLNNHILKS